MVIFASRATRNLVGRVADPVTIGIGTIVVLPVITDGRLVERVPPVCIICMHDVFDEIIAIHKVARTMAFKEYAFPIVSDGVARDGHVA